MGPHHGARAGGAGPSLVAAWVGEICDDFERQLALWRVRYAGRPEREILRLYLLALEREENVVVAYDGVLLGRRLAAMDLPDPVRSLIGRTLARVREDEQMHTLYVRRVLRPLARPLLGLRTFLQQTAGAVGGWTASRRQHVRWSDAPLSRSAATLLLWGGRLTGRVPGCVRRHLDYCSFRDFCRYNVGTESTAWLCWQRLAALALRVPALPCARIDEFRRIADDEDRHRRIFGLVAEALTDDDRLRAGATVETLTDGLGALGRVLP
jgi:hypothetical protein